VLDELDPPDDVEELLPKKLVRDQYPLEPPCPPELRELQVVVAVVGCIDAATPGAEDGGAVTPGLTGLQLLYGTSAKAVPPTATAPVNNSAT